MDEKIKVMSTVNNKHTCAKKDVKAKDCCHSSSKSQSLQVLFIKQAAQNAAFLKSLRVQT